MLKHWIIVLAAATALPSLLMGQSSQVTTQAAPTESTANAEAEKKEAAKNTDIPATPSTTTPAIPKYPDTGASTPYPLPRPSVTGINSPGALQPYSAETSVTAPNALGPIEQGAALPSVTDPNYQPSFSGQSSITAPQTEGPAIKPQEHEF